MFGQQRGQQLLFDARVHLPHGQRGGVDVGAYPGGPLAVDTRQGGRLAPFHQGGGGAQRHLRVPGRSLQVNALGGQFAQAAPPFGRVAQHDLDLFRPPLQFLDHQ